MTIKLKEVWHRLPMSEQVCLWVPEAVLRSLLSEAGFSGFLQLIKLLLTSKKQLFLTVACSGLSTGSSVPPKDFFPENLVTTAFKHFKMKFILPLT